MKKLYILQRSHCFLHRISYLILILISLSSALRNLCNAQNFSQNPPLQITVGKGTLIYSVDNSFNEQIKSSKTDLQIYEESEKELLVVAGNAAFDLKKISKKEKKFRRKKLNKLIQEIPAEKHLSQKSQTQFSTQFNLADEKFQRSHHPAADCLTTSTNNFNFYKIILHLETFFKLELSYLYQKESLQYNSSSLNSSFYKSFPVRPPPVKS